MQRVQLGWRMLGSREFEARNLSVGRDVRCHKKIRGDQHRHMECHMRNGQDVWRLRRNHSLAAIMGLIRGIARHRAAALHAPLILRHRGHAIRKLQTQKGHDRHDAEQSFPHDSALTLRRLDAPVNERIPKDIYPRALSTCGQPVFATDELESP